MNLPSFLIIGAAKSGTTALYRYLGQHPQIFMCPVKEPAFFAFEGEDTRFHWADDKDRSNRYYAHLDEYAQLFQEVSAEIAIGEASTDYLYDPKAKAAERIRHYIPHARLIAILRDPVDAAYSHFLHGVRDGLEPLDDFERALQQEEERIENNWSPFYHYGHKGFYYRQIKPYFDLFGQDQLKVYLYEDWRSDNASVLREIQDFLGVDAGYVPDLSVSYNRSGVPRSRALDRFLRGSHPLRHVVGFFVPARMRPRVYQALLARNMVKPELPPQVRGRLISVYRQDILGLQDLIGRDLTAWLQI